MTLICNETCLMNEFRDLYVSNDSLMMQVKEIIYFGSFLFQSTNRLTEIDTSIHLLFSFLIAFLVDWQG